MIDLREGHLKLLREMLLRRLPGLDVRAFGSRVTGRSKPHSDLDLVVMTDAPLGAVTLAELRADLDESDLPFRVDVVEWWDLPAGLRQEVERRSEPVLGEMQGS